MKLLHKRWLAVPVAGAALAGFAVIGGASAASAATPSASASATASYGMSDGLPPVLGNLGDATDMLLNHLQYEHLNQPLLGLGPAIQDPTGWVTGHVAPLVLEVAGTALGSGSGMGS